MNQFKILTVFANDQTTKLYEDFYYTNYTKDPNLTLLDAKVYLYEYNELNPTDEDELKKISSKVRTIYIRLRDILGINKEVKDMETRLQIFNGTLLQEKLDRYEVFCKLVVDFLGYLLTHLYWLKIPSSQRYSDEDDLLNFIIRVGGILMKEINTMVAKQYNLVEIVEAELKKTENVLNKRKKK